MLPDEDRLELAASIKRYFLLEREEEIGDLQAHLFPEFVLKEVGPSIYNQAARDVQAKLQAAVADLDSTLHEPEFGYPFESKEGRPAPRRRR